MRKTLILPALLLSSLTSFGQHDFGLKADGGVSRLTARFHSSQTTQKFPVSPSGQGGLFYNFNLGKTSLIGAELLFVQIEGKEKTETLETSEYNSLTGGAITTKVYRHISYFGLPVYYGLKIKRLTLDLGFQVNFTLASSGREKGQATDGNGATASWDVKYAYLNIDNYDYGPRAGLMFRLSDKFSIEAIYYHGINNILANDIELTRWKWKVQQATLGLRYKFISVSKKGKNTAQ